MRFKKGCEVEVLNKKEVLTGAWLCAEIISGNGHTYSVRYGWFPVTRDAVVERVPRKAIRPCPPPVEGADKWVPGDYVEVFHNLSWKTAAIVKVLGVNNFLVRILGACQELEVHRFHLRVRQCWQDGNWFVLGKGSAYCTMSTGQTFTDMKLKQGVGKDCFAVNKNSGMQVTDTPTRTRKRRSLFGSTDCDAYHVAGQKVRAIETGGSLQRKFPGHPWPLCEKVDAYKFRQQKLGAKYMHTSFNTGGFEISERVMDRRKENGLSVHSGTSTTVNTESSTSSVASCSVCGNVFPQLPLYFIKHHNKDTESHSSDAESICGGEYEEEECSLSKNEEVVRKVHRSELHSYRSTIEAMYTSGPLSWEDEAKLMDLRCALHVSDDEHLAELRNLIATDRFIVG